MKKLIYVLTLSLILTSCILDDDTFAPVSEINTIEPIPKQGIHHVKPKETLYSIAWRYGIDYRDIAKYNHIASPYPIHTGQVIYLTKKKPALPTKNMTPTITRTPANPTIIKVASSKKNVPQSKPPLYDSEPTAKITFWNKPSNGPVIGKFSSLNKGINIGGHEGDPIFATAAGKVVYSGDGLRGYGNLIIIKHNSTFLTAYAHNSKVFVKDGEWVKAKQCIAEMGSTSAPRPMLHFEIRRNGKPVDPLIFIGE